MKLAIIVTVTLISLSCHNKIYQSTESFYKEQFSNRPDYESLNNWAAHPWKKDPSDSLPKPLSYQINDSLTDVFFIHPTTYVGIRKGWNADLEDYSLNLKTDLSTILYQASVFNQHCRIFAPRYRQAHISAFFVNNKKSEEAFDTAYSDIKSAFEVYLKEYNKGKPFIIAGHSQGAKMAERLIKEFIDGKPLQKKLIVAYIIGWPVPSELFQRLQPCTSPYETGCFCTWRTFQKGYIPSYIEKESPKSYVTNPLSWSTDSSFIDKIDNKGSILKNFDKIYFHLADAQVHDGVLWTNKPHFPGSVFYLSKNYHIADINLYYINLRENIELRIHSFKENN
jgi:Protein of unknown function (DUF3089).